ncbi:MAG: HesA/MoeB/ThiF family protein [Candidatus Odinarchaeum yellowstonii]|uniref:HesA/MoeB/ThiF family protein n=1 Tax=Odinarchaeota yellowstonii (strain LCB_4) TaxID=1841599 RepID=A0AAF0D287_ODILC|nr:MAG: HesA/MoeB/ThiF family protein [Candidatus Odinarchaeum yellowstonii]
MFTDEELERYSRQLVLPRIGREGQLKLKNSRVCIIGVGGLGWLTSLQLAAMGVGYLRLVDRDIVELSNLQRQLLFEVDDINKSKSETAARRIKRVNPNIHVDPLMVSINLDNVHDIIRGFDVVVDCLDNFKARMILNYACVKAGEPLVYASAIRLYGAVHTVIPGVSACLECLYGDVESLEAESCAEAGVLPTILGAVSSMASQEVLNILLNGEPALSKSMLVMDFESCEFDKIFLERNPNCRICGVNRVDLKPTGEIPVERLCTEGSYMISPLKPVRLDLKKLEDQIRLKYQVYKTTPVFIEFYYAPEITVTLVRSGGILFKGVSSEEEARRIYRDLQPLIEASKS